MIVTADPTVAIPVTLRLLLTLRFPVGSMRILSVFAVLNTIGIDVTALTVTRLSTVNDPVSVPPTLPSIVDPVESFKPSVT